MIEPLLFHSANSWGGRACTTFVSWTTFILITRGAGEKHGFPLSPFQMNSLRVEPHPQVAASHSGLRFLALRARNLPGVIRYSLLSGCHRGECWTAPSSLGAVGPFKSQAGWVGGQSQPWVVPHPLSAPGAFRLQELVLSERMLISSGICAVTGFDPGDQ